MQAEEAEQLLADKLRHLAVLEHPRVKKALQGKE
jgi:hypothetical protein